LCQGFHYDVGRLLSLWYCWKGSQPLAISIREVVIYVPDICEKVIADEVKVSYFDPMLQLSLGNSQISIVHPNFVLNFN